MNAKLQEALDVLAQLPESEQEQLAEALLLEIRTRDLWDASFQKSADLLDEMGDEAMAQHKAGKTIPIDPDEI